MCLPVCLPVCLLPSQPKATNCHSHIRCLCALTLLNSHVGREGGVLVERQVTRTHTEDSCHQQHV